MRVTPETRQAAAQLDDAANAPDSPPTAIRPRPVKRWFFAGAFFAPLPYVGLPLSVAFMALGGYRLLSNYRALKSHYKIDFLQTVAIALCVLFWLIVSIGNLAGTADEIPGVTSPTLPASSATDQEPSFKIHRTHIAEIEHLRKGGIFSTGQPPRYVELSVSAHIVGPATITENEALATATSLIKSTRQRAQAENWRADAISIRLWYHANDIGTRGADVAAEWWPKGHTLDPRNNKNIVNKKTHTVETYLIFPTEFPVVVPITTQKLKATKITGESMLP